MSDVKQFDLNGKKYALEDFSVDQDEYSADILADIGFNRLLPHAPAIYKIYEAMTADEENDAEAKGDSGAEDVLGGLGLKDFAGLLEIDVDGFIRAIAGKAILFRMIAAALTPVNSHWSKEVIDEIEPFIRRMKRSEYFPVVAFFLEKFGLSMNSEGDTSPTLKKAKTGNRK